VTRRDKLTSAGIHAEIEELVSELWQVPRFAGLRRGFRPNVDSYRTGEPPRLTVVVELPGVDPKSLNVLVDERALVIAGERVRPKVQGGAVYQQMEIEYGPFRRIVRLTEDVDPERANARYDRGVLTVSLPIAEKPPPSVGGYAIVVTRI
jgi:HSP20 family protein